MSEDARTATSDDPRVMVDFAATCLQKMLDVYGSKESLSPSEETQKRKLIEKALGALVIAISDLKRAVDPEHPDKSKVLWQTRSDQTLINVQLAKAYALQGKESDSVLNKSDYPGLWTLEAQRDKWDELGKAVSVFNKAKSLGHAKPLEHSS